MVERRGGDRVRISLELAAGDGSELRELEARNISLGGMLVAAKGGWPVGTQITLKFRRRGVRYETTAIVAHRIIHRYDHGMGLAFINPDERFLWAVSELMEDRAA